MKPNAWNTVGASRTRRPWAFTWLAIAGWLAVAGSAMAQAQNTQAANANANWPTRPVRLVVAFAPAGPADIIARLVGQRLSETVGQPFVVENKPGAGGSVASTLVSKAEPDGYTLLVNTSS